MVDALSPMAGRVRIGQSGEQSAARPVSTESTPQPVAPARDDIRLGLPLKASLPAGEMEGPPFDLVAVARIKDAIREGNYPIDRDRIADRLFQSYYELTL